MTFIAIYQSKTARTIAAYASWNMVAMILGMLGSLVQARYMDPEDMGVFRTFSILLGYITFFQLGVFDGLQREIPLQVGRGKPEKAELAASACLAWIIAISLVTSVCFLGLGLRAAYIKEWMQFWGWLSFIPVALMTFYGGYLGTTFRTGQQFVTLSKTSVIQSLVATVALPLLPILGYYGACIRTTASSIIGVCFLHRWRPMRLKACLDWPSLREVLRVGLPMSGIGYILTSLWISVEGTLILAWFGTSALGLYSVAVFIRTITSQLTQNISQILTVKMCQHYGASNNAEQALRLIIKPVALAFLASLPLIGFGWVLIPWAVSCFIPKYSNATTIMQVFLFMMPVTILRIPTAILWIDMKLLDSFVAVILGFLAFVLIACYSKFMNYGLIGVAIAFVAGQVVYLINSAMLTSRIVFRERRRLCTN